MAMFSEGGIKMRLLRAVGCGAAYAAAAAVTAMVAFCLLAPPVIAMREGRTGAPDSPSPFRCCAGAFGTSPSPRRTSGLSPAFFSSWRISPPAPDFPAN